MTSPRNNELIPKDKSPPDSHSVEKLLKRILELEKANAKEKRENEQLQGNAMTLQGTVASLQGTIHDLNSALQGTVASLQGTIHDLNSEKDEALKKGEEWRVKFFNLQTESRQLEKDVALGVRYRNLFLNQNKYSDAAFALELREFLRIYIVGVTKRIASDVKAERMASMNLFEVKRIVAQYKRSILSLMSKQDNEEVPQVDKPRVERIVFQLRGDAILGLENLLVALMDKDFKKLSFNSFLQTCEKLENWNDELNDFVHEGRPTIASLKKGLEIAKEKNILPQGSLYIEEMESSFDDYEPSSAPVVLPKSQNVERSADTPRQHGRSSNPFSTPNPAAGRSPVGSSRHHYPDSEDHRNRNVRDDRSRGRNDGYHSNGPRSAPPAFAWSPNESRVIIRDERNVRTEGRNDSYRGNGPGLQRSDYEIRDERNVRPEGRDHRGYDARYPGGRNDNYHEYDDRRGRGDYMNCDERYVHQEGPAGGYHGYGSGPAHQQPNRGLRPQSHPDGRDDRPEGRDSSRNARARQAPPPEHQNGRSRRKHPDEDSGVGQTPKDERDTKKPRRSA